MANMRPLRRWTVDVGSPAFMGYPEVVTSTNRFWTRRAADRYAQFVRALGGAFVFARVRES